MRSYENSVLKSTKYYAGVFEKIVNTDGSYKEYTYINTPTGLSAVNIKNSDGSNNLYYIHTDYLGSIMALTNQYGAIAESYFYDAWGRRKNPDNYNQPDTRTSLLIDRGFTGHEHLDNVGLINMNGRLYDPLLGRMLSPDIFVQNSSFTQSFNRYSYCWNNPLRYTDPSGYIVKPSDNDIDRTGGGNYSIMHFFTNGLDKRANSNNLWGDGTYTGGYTGLNYDQTMYILGYTWVENIGEWVSVKTINDASNEGDGRINLGTDSNPYSTIVDFLRALPHDSDKQGLVGELFVPSTGKYGKSDGRYGTITYPVTVRGHNIEIILQFNPDSHLTGRVSQKNMKGLNGWEFDIRGYGQMQLHNDSYSPMLIRIHYPSYDAYGLYKSTWNYIYGRTDQW